MQPITIHAPVVNIYSMDDTTILSQLSAVLERLNLMSPQMQALVDAVQQNTSVTNSAVALIQGLKAMVDQAAQGSNDPVIAQLAQAIGEADAALAAAITANTPSAPPAGGPTA